MNWIETKNLNKSYKTVEVSIQDIVISNRITIIKGPNGCGKSTLLKAIMGWIQYTGEIKINGSVSYMPEHHSFPKDITVRTFLLGLHHDIQSIHSLLRQFHLEDKIDAMIETLSKGMKAKLNMVQCFLLERDIYLLDEPFSGLDVDSVKMVSQYINTSQKVFVITTHITGIQLDGEVIPFD
jgi:ABC-2 type transport system ATP-binding protein